MKYTQVIINSIASVNALLLFLLLFFRKNNSLPNYAMSGMMLILGCFFLNNLVMFGGYGPTYSYLFFTVQFMGVFFVPLISVYTFSLLGKNLYSLLPIFIISGILGLIPIYLAIEYYGTNQELQNQFFHKLLYGTYPESVTIYSIIFYSFQQIVFIGLYILVRRVKNNAYNFFADIDKSKLRYLQQLMLILVVLNFSIVALYLSFDVLFVEYILLPIIVTIIYMFIVYNAFANHAIFSKDDFLIYFKEAEKFSKIHLEQNTNILDDHIAILNKIEEALLDQNLLTDCELTLQKLADAIDISSSSLSQIINKDLDSNFYDLINSRRINLAKELLLKKENLTIEGIGYESGFNSRASFYRAFKKYTEKTPKSYLEDINLKKKDNKIAY